MDWATGASPFQSIATDVDGDQRPDLAVTSFGGDLVPRAAQRRAPGGRARAGRPQDLGSVTVGETRAHGDVHGRLERHRGAARRAPSPLTGAGFSEDGGHLLGRGSSPTARRCSVTVAFAPGTAGAAAGGTLTIPTDDGPLVTALTATGRADAAGLRPHPHPDAGPPEPPTPPTARRAAAHRRPPRPSPLREPPRHHDHHAASACAAATVTIAMGKRRIARIARARATVKVDLTGVAQGRVRVTLAKGKARDLRVYRTCTAKRT